MTFPVVSVSTITARCRRYALSVAQRSAVRNIIVRGGVFNCRTTSGTDRYSSHAFGDAVDLFPKSDVPDALHSIAMNAVRQATQRTIANRGIRCPIVQVIFRDSEWIAGIGWRHYAGVFHASHVHVGFRFSTSEKPPCAQ